MVLTPPIIRKAVTPADLAEVSALFHDYADWLKAAISLYDFAEEMKIFPRPYVEPDGVLLLAEVNGKIMGAVGVRRIGADICEMKRLYTHPDARGQGLGRRLADAAVAFGRDAGYRAMRLDTIPELAAAQTLYESMGFEQIEPYNPNPPDRVLFFEKLL